ncbi:hypothetical protein [Pseudomonas sp. GM80]|uniref:hypothetical protein n=1 Tax=Pseudomonas sp. GM80 TaxID=1144339 RepID=UPI00026F9D3C|nr:hypothetical protein [Pseudomonas sp. GM80]EJN34533.1 hypothetical protein PMI37_01006 [Pseudomonas sp. GM80]
MTTGVLEQKSLYNKGDYVYGDGKGKDTDGDGKKEIDCSTLVWEMLKTAGYKVPYSNTTALKINVTNYDVIEWKDVLPGDIALWPTHTGFVEDIDVENKSGNFFGSQNSTGPATAKFGTGSNFWPMPIKFLRVKEIFKTGSQPASTPEPAPVTPPAPTAYPLMNFQYPFRKSDGTQFKDSEEIFKALESEGSGNFLLGNHGFWHGGIHISDASAPYCVKNEPVRCMADGVVVAYRLNEDYLQSDYSGDKPAKLKYSNSFCLVRHDYKSLANPEEGANKKKQNSLVFFSLYMHLMPYKGYLPTEEELGKPKIKFKVGDFTARSDVEDGPGCEKYGMISVGTVFEVLDEKLASNGITYAKGKLLSGKVPNRKVGQEAWFAYKKDGVVLTNKKDTAIWSAILPPERTRPGYWKGVVKARVTAPNGLPLYAVPSTLANGESAGEPMGEMALCLNSEIKFDGTKVFNLKVGSSLVRMAECICLSGGLRGAGAVPPIFWACVEDIGKGRMVAWAETTPTEFDKVIACQAPIKAGHPVGFLGLQENPGKVEGSTTSKYHAHIEIFTSDTGLDKFLQNEAALKVGMSYMKLPAGTVLASKAAAGQSSTLESEHTVPMGSVTTFKDSQGVEWYEPTVTEKNKKLTGLIKKVDVTFTSSGAQLISQHDWAKLGFTVVKEGDENSDGFLDPDTMPPFFKELHAKLDALGNTDGEVTSADLNSALKNVEFRDKWTKLIAYHPTEWQAKSSEPKWSRLDKLLEDSPKLLKHEKERIDKLVFWDELAGVLQMTLPKQVYHFHPIAFVNNFMKFAVPGKGWAHSAFANLLASVESNNDYTAYNKTKGGHQSFYKTDLTTWTIAELQKKQMDRDVLAAGRYQMIADTINGAVKKLELDTSLKFDEKMQDKIFEEYLIRIKRKAFIQYLEGDGDIEKAAYAWALEFASAGVRKGKTISPVSKKDENGVTEMKDGKPVMLARVASFEGQSYYDGVGTNAAHILPVDMIRVLEESKNNGN